MLIAAAVCASARAARLTRDLNCLVMPACLTFEYGALCSCGQITVNLLLRREAFYLPGQTVFVLKVIAVSAEGCLMVLDIFGEFNPGEILRRLNCSGYKYDLYNNFLQNA